MRKGGGGHTYLNKNAQEAIQVYRRSRGGRYDSNETSPRPVEERETKTAAVLSSKVQQ